MLKPKLIALSAALALVMGTSAAPAATSGAVVPAAAGFQPSDAQAAAARLVYGILSDSRYVYRAKPLDDALSAEIHRRHLESLDGQKLFFTQADIARFQGYASGHDDAIKDQQLDPAYDIFTTYVKRVDQRVAFARQLLAKPFDFSTDETWAYDREDAPWATDGAELD
nr:tail-specific protease [Arenimonas sp.]